MGLLVLLTGLGWAPGRAWANDAMDTSPLKRGILAYNDGELERAEQTLRAALRVVKTPTERARAWLYLGLTQAARNRVDAARASFRAALREDPRVMPDRKRVAPPVLRLFTAVKRSLAGTLVVEASEPGARVFVDGTERGPAPARLLLAPGKYRVRVLSGDGNRAAPEATAQVRSGQTTKLAARLVPLRGKVRVLALPAGARIDAPGARPAGSDPAVLSLPAGRHRLRFRAPGFRGAEREVVVRPRQTLELTVELAALPRPWYRRRRPWGWITLGLSAASATAGLLAARSAQSAQDAIRSGQQNGTLDFDRYRTLVSGVESNQRIANILLGVSGAAAVTGLVLVLIGDRSERAPPRRAGWRLIPTPGGAAVAGRF